MIIYTLYTQTYVGFSYARFYEGYLQTHFLLKQFGSLIRNSSHHSSPPPTFRLLKVLPLTYLNFSCFNL
ncbi:hypothetical protein JL_16 [Bacillus phage JL]|uniref:Uncharacterized protein n=1 Tax=Bacillus phage JL TaxID=1296655 RepID=V5TGD1_9CAUD|nr:hypothetical protein AVV47_gp016 [Bacillus phage JL]AHB63472.1 hypothetical protein JL_16 [Bacillus phage JL]